MRSMLLNEEVAESKDGPRTFTLAYYAQQLAAAEMRFKPTPPLERLVAGRTRYRRGTPVRAWRIHNLVWVGEGGLLAYEGEHPLFGRQLVAYNLKRLGPQEYATLLSIVKRRLQQLDDVHAR